MYTIILADGTKLENLELNGNNFIAKNAIEDSVFDGNLDTVTITDGETTETFTDMRLMSNIVRNGRSWIVLGDAPVKYPNADARARAKRDNLLAETDWTQVLDAPISAECREAFRVYRQALRDITEQEGFPETIEWPTMPEVVKAAPDPVDTAVDVLLGGDEV